MSTTKFIKHFIACIITLIAVSSCANNEPKLSLEEIEEKADFMLLYKKHTTLKIHHLTTRYLKLPDLV